MGLRISSDRSNQALDQRGCCYRLHQERFPILSMPIHNSQLSLPTARASSQLIIGDMCVDESREGEDEEAEKEETFSKRR